ncbi:MAG: amino acid adenylation domain-containing protein [Byssovorax sp.]
MSRNNIADIHPLTPMQQGILFHALYSGDRGAYVVESVTTLRGALDPAALQRALQAVVERHPSLRSAFVWEKIEQPVQVVWRRVPVPIEQEDLRGLSAGEQERRLRERLEGDRSRGFELGRAPLMRVALVRTGESEHRLVWTAHHLLLDGWSSGIVQKELFALYDAERRGEPLRLEPAASNAELLAWLDRQDRKVSEAFFRRKLAGFSEPTPLGIDHPADGEISGPRFGEQRALLSETASADLATFARQHKLTPAVVLEGAFALLLSRYSGRDDVLFGAVVSGRSAPVRGIDRMVGVLINTLPVRVRAPEGDEVIAWLTALQGEQAELIEHEHSPLAEVQALSEVPRGTPLFESLFVFENYPIEPGLGRGGEGSGAIGVVESRAYEQPAYPLTVAGVFRRSLMIQIGYDRRRFDDASIGRMLGHLQVLLGALVGGAGRRLGELSLLTAAERDELVSGFNRAAVAHPGAALLHALVEEQVDRSPDAEAVISEREALSFRALDERANRLAHHLVETGFGRGGLLAICLPRSIGAVVAMLAALKAGGAYLPIDPGYPRDRVAFMIADSRASALVTTHALGASLSVDAGRTILVEEIDALVAGQPSTRPAIGVAPDDLAYVIYTSGSTGTPKGVMIPHRAIANHMRWMSAAFPLGADDAVLQKTPLGFDASVWEIYAPLMSGARLVLGREGSHRDPAELLRAVEEERITVLQVVPSLLGMLAEEPALPRATGLRRLFAGGEALPRALVERVWSALPGLAVVNLYGPTEVTIDATFWRCEPGSSGAAIEPIGRPIDNVRAHVLDASRRLVPIGVPGELYLGGAGVGAGYLHRAELTAERFLPDPFNPTPGARIYRTGDRCRIRPDGALEFLGRADEQVKVRGHRVEPGEVEAVLRRHPALLDVAVVVREDTPGDARIVAYTVPRSAPGPSAAELRDMLSSALPEAFLPAAFVELGALPRLGSGKIDRRALPLPDAGAAVDRGYVAPRGPIEEAVAAIFGEVLKAGDVGAHSDFFELGGHSLTATQVIARARASLGVDLPLQALFAAPTPARLAARIKIALGSEASLVEAPIPRAPRDGPLEPSFAQERLWFLAELDPEGTAFHIVSRVLLRGTLDPAALEQAFAELVRRHEVLRTTFDVLEGRPVQVIHAAMPIELDHLDLSRLPEAERQTALALAREAVGRPFDLATGPLFRARLLSSGPAEHLLLLGMHHIVSDAWSQGIFNRELTALYEAFVQHRPSPLPELPIQYADYAAWQRRTLAGDTLGRLRDYWKEQLDGASFALDLPTDHPRPPAQRYAGAQRSRVLSPALSAALRELSRREGVTLFMTLLAALDVLLHRYTGQLDFVVGTSVANRTRPETEGLIGFFINPLVLRAKVTPALTFKELLAQVKTTCLGAYAHQDMPFEKLVAELAPEPDPSRPPLFQVIFTMLNAPRGERILPGLAQRTINAESRTAKYELTFLMGESPEGLAVAIEHRSDLFEGATIERMLGHLQTLLEGAARDPKQPIGRMAMLPEDERHRVLTGWNEREPAGPVDQCFHDLFELAAERSPDAAALVAVGETLSFRELDRRANRLAHHLRRQGVGPEEVVGLRLGRGAALVIGLLGILKAGGAYLPLDPTFPPQRVSGLLADARASVLVTDREGELSIGPGAWRVVRLDADAALIAAESDARPEVEMLPQNLAYVIFTSGSTGKPKGVAIEHRQLVSYVRGVSARLSLPEGGSYAHVSTIAADLGHTVLFPPLASGGTLHLIAEELTTDPAALADYFERRPIDCLKIVPSHLAALLAAPRPERLMPREVLVLGGEPSSWEMVERLSALRPSCRIFNHYGPTETTVGVLTYAVTPGARPVGAAIVPLGRPLPGAEIYLLDGAMQPSPIGVPGEIYVGGAQVGRGYLNQPERTAERFVDDPFRAPRGGKLYRTGDRARALPDGTFVFSGRTDDQVKIRGYRIELAEIEAALRLHPALTGAAVIAAGEVPSERRLVAYVAAAPGPEAPSPEALRLFLGERLPSYMLPSSFVVMEALPLLPNGKIDRRALPAPDPGEQTAGLDGDAPRTPIEEVLAGIWADVLGKPRIGIHERFTDLGGHSLLAIQIVARARDAFQRQIPLRAIFEAPTIAGLAERVAATMRAEEGLEAPPIAPISRGGPLRLSSAQERLWFLHQLDPDDPSYNITGALRLSGPLDTGALAQALGAVVARHEVLRTTFATDDGRPVQIIHAPAPVELPVRDLSGRPEVEREASVRNEVAFEAEQPFDLADGPLLRCRLLRLGAEEHLLLLTMHHIVSDARTRAIFSRELSAFYAAFKDGRSVSLPPLPIQYADYAAWQRSWLSGAVLGKKLDYWRRQLDGATRALELPIDHPRPAVPTRRGQRRTIRFSPALSEAVAALARREGTTLFMVLLAAFDVLLFRYTGQEDFVVGSPVLDRPRPELEGLIGFFLNTVVLRATVTGELSFLELLGQVRETCLGAYTHQDVPFERLVEELEPDRELGRSPLFQVLFTLDGAPRERESAVLPGLKRRPADVPSSTAKYDLSLGMIDGPGGLAASIEYRTELFEQETIDRMLGHLQALLEGIVADPSRAVGDLPLLSEAERRTLLAWNETGADYPRDLCAHQLFEEQVERTPGAIAVVFEGFSLTYRELDRRSNQLAHHLKGRGVRPGQLVGILVERSLDMVVSMLAVLKAGGAYVPLDPTYPRDRLGFMVSDAELKLILTQERLASVVPAGGAELIRLDADRPKISVESESPIAGGAAPEDLAYVIYTSGSTGRPKGVEIPHRALVAFLCAMKAQPGMDADDRLLAVTSLSFDIAGLEIFLPLTVGAQVEVASWGLSLDGRALVERVKTSKITMLQATPSTYRLLLGAGFNGAGIKALIGGEAVPRELAAELSRSCRSLWNMYGPTETTIWSTVHRIQPGEETVLIGRPIANTQVYVLDARLSLAPIGVAGELYIGGDGLAHGYLHRPSLTSERFVPSPFGPTPEARLYRTGDRARLRPDGALEFLGRADQQVKIRGYRIELDEVTAALEQHPAVRQAVVVARDDGSGDKRLVAYLVASAEGAPAPEELRAFLRQKLPEMMVPAAFVRMDALPLTPNGKIDRRALPAPESGDIHGTQGLVLPRDETESMLAAIWCDVLGLQTVGVLDSFFDLGGHSLLAVKMLDELKTATGKSLPLAALFEARTVAALASLIRAEETENRWPTLVPIKPEGVRRPLFLVSRPNVNALGYVALARHVDPSFPIYGLQDQYPEESALHRPYTKEEYDAWATAYLARMRTIQPKGPYLIGGMCEGALIAFTMARHLEAQGETVALLAMMDAWPEENTRSLVLNRVKHYENDLRRFLALGNEEKLRFFTQKAGRALSFLTGGRAGVPPQGPPPSVASPATVRKPGGFTAGAPPSTVRVSATESWLERQFPGSGFVPLKVSCKISVFRVKNQPYWRINDEQLGWGDRTTRGVEVNWIAGEHGDFMREPHVTVLGQKLTTTLRRVAAELDAQGEPEASWRAPSRR